MGSFQWVNADADLSCNVLTTHVNSSGWLDPPTLPADGPSEAGEAGEAGEGGRAPGAGGSTCGAWRVGKEALSLGTGHDLCNPRAGGGAQCSGDVTGPKGCCAACSQGLHPKKGPSRCGAWFWNGNTTDCSGHGCCYLKDSATADHVTPPNHAFAAGLGPANRPEWCDYSGVYNTPNACPAPVAGKPTCACASFAVIGKGLGWELGWAAHRRHWTRLIVLHRWLGQAAHVEQTTLFGESLVYDCIKNGYASRAVQFHPDRGQFDFVWLPVRTPHVRPMGRTCGEPNEIKKDAHLKIHYRSFPWAGSAPGSRRR